MRCSRAQTAKTPLECDLFRRYFVLSCEKFRDAGRGIAPKVASRQKLQDFVCENKVSENEKLVFESNTGLVLKNAGIRTNGNGFIPKCKIF